MFVNHTIDHCHLYSPRQVWNLRARPARGLAWAITTICVVVISLEYRFFASSDEAISITLQEVVIYTLMLSFLVTQRFSGTFHAFSRSRFTGLLLTYMAVILFTAISSQYIRDVSEPLGYVKDILPGCTLCLMIAATPNTRVKFQDLTIAYSYAMTLGSLLAIVQYTTGQFYMLDVDGINLMKSDFSGEWVTRPAVGFFGHPNNFAFVLAPCIPVLWAAAIRGYKVRGDIMPSVALLINLAALSLTFSRSAVLLVIIAVVGLHVKTWYWSRRLIVLLCVMSVVFVVTAGVFLKAEKGFFAAGTLSGRAALWSSATQVVSQPGFRFNGGANEELALVNVETMSFMFNHGHNLYLNQFVYFGLIAGVCFLGLWYRSLPRGLGAGRDVSCRAITASVMIVSVMSIFEGTMGVARSGSVLLWLFWSACINESEIWTRRARQAIRSSIPERRLVVR